MVGSKTGKGPRGDFKSQVPHVMLHLNPGVSRQLDKQLSTLERLRVKASTLFQVSHFLNVVVNA